MEGVKLQIGEKEHELITAALLGDFSMLIPFAEHLGDGIYLINQDIVQLSVNWSFEMLNMYSALAIQGSEELNVPNLLADNRGLIVVHILQTAYMAWLLSTAMTPQPPKRRKSTIKPEADFYVTPTKVRS